MKYPGYFLIVADFIQWAKAQGIPVGPGRGSGAGSLVAWSLTITDLDPLRFDLLFERFLNPDRVSMPDFDVDFCQNRRDEVIRYVQQKYGADQVAQIITFGTLQARAVLRDVGRVLQMPYGQVDRLAKMVPQNPANPVTLAKAIADEPQLQAARDDDRAGRAPARHRAEARGALPPRLDPRRRHRHRRPAARPAGAALPRPALGHAGHPVQHEMGRAGGAGEVRLPRPEDADRARHRGAAAPPARHRDRPVAHPARRRQDLTSRWRGARRSACSRWKARGMRRALVDMRPDRFEDLIALVALYRPGPMANIPTYCPRKHGTEPVEYLHPLLEPILKETYGIITYQEQVQQIARDLAGYTLAEADLLRRAMGKKIKAEMDAQRDRFLTGADRARRRRQHRQHRSSTPAPSSPNTASTSRTRRPTR